MATLLESVFASLLLLPLFYSTGLAAPTATSTAPSTGLSTGLSTCAASMDDSLPGEIPSDFEFSGNIRRYYIAAEQVLWDYVPSGWDNYEGVPIEKSFRAAAEGPGSSANN